jgi:hypothetical protein
MRVSRRTILKGAGALGAVSAAAVVAQEKNLLIAVFDSRLPEANAFAADARQRGLKTIDISANDREIWQIAREDLVVSETIIGLTGWSDWLMLRGLLEEQGKRMTHQRRLTHTGNRLATPFEWSMT